MNKNVLAHANNNLEHSNFFSSFIKETRIPDDKSQVDTFSVIVEELFERGRILMEEKSKEGQAGENEDEEFVEYERWEIDKLPKTYYRDCMDRERKEQIGLQPAVDLIER